MESPETPRFRGISRLLARRVSVAAWLEVALWLSFGYVVAGVGWLFIHPDSVERIQLQAQQQFGIPPDSIYELATVAEVTVLWPVVLLLPSGACGA
ncbi:hypothetical protein KIH27_01945 [Mycobacterium sp. M1]|uniref:Uncharacterized protein n=1 Tax=Mycolicibacter acidiphilus TaxID=2835306 RepID=A0ABS5REF5_9MYCO|nr:hypothetical protein [Mycolicibacter acidiphilus]MBS9532347.1 hypothetical protein [Mycolicibacter acidiphilus]